MLVGSSGANSLVWRMESFARLVAETAAWEKQRNAARARIKWMFTARAKIGRAYPMAEGDPGPRQRVKTSVTRN